MGKTDGIRWNTTRLHWAMQGLGLLAGNAPAAPAPPGIASASGPDQWRAATTPELVEAPVPIDLPARFNVDWAWRPDVWCGPLMAQGVRLAGNLRCARDIAVFHDGNGTAPALHQTRNRMVPGRASHGVTLDIDDFDGSYVSLAVDLPDAALLRLSQRHIFEVKAVIEMDEPVTVFFRLNIRHGPNTAKIIRQVPFGVGEVVAPFELTYTPFNAHRVRKAWVDVIFEGTRSNRITLHDLTFSRRPRAEI